MSALPLVSAIIPCYNRAAYVAAAIESVLHQTYEHIELLVVDDGSTDGSRAVLERYAGRLRLLEHPGRANRGQSAAINLALGQARGAYVGILDSDDLWLPTKIASQVAYMESHPEVGLVYGNGEAVDAAGRSLYDIYPPGHHEGSDAARVLLDCYFLVPNNSLIRRSVLDEAGPFDESLRAAQDHDMAIRIAEITRLAYLDEKLFQYRRHPDSISQKNALARWRNGFLIVEKARKRGRHSSAALRKRKGVLHFRLGQCLREQGQTLAALRHFVAAGLHDPARAARVLLRLERAGSPH